MLEIAKSVKHDFVGVSHLPEIQTTSSKINHHLIIFFQFCVSEMIIFEFFILSVITGRKIEKSRPNFVVVVTDAFDGRIVKNRSYKNIVEVIKLNILYIFLYRFDKKNLNSARKH